MLVTLTSFNKYVKNKKFITDTYCSFKDTFQSGHYSCLQALEDAFLAIDGRITTEEVIKELVQISGRPVEEPPSEKVAEEDDCKLIKPLMSISL